MHTSGRMNGKSTITLASPYHNYENISCVQFFFSMQSPVKQHWTSLTVSRQDAGSRGGPKKVIWRMRSLADNIWHFAMQTVNDGNFRLLFELNGDNVRAAIDDIAVINGECSPENISEHEDSLYSIKNITES